MTRVYHHAVPFPLETAHLKTISGKMHAGNVAYVNAERPAGALCFADVDRLSFSEAAKRLLMFRTPPPTRPDIRLCPADDCDVLIGITADALVDLRHKAPPVGLTDDELMAVRAYTYHHPYPLYALLNAWLMGNRRDEEVQANVGPFAALLLRALHKLPTIEVDGQRACRVANVAGLQTTYDHPDRECQQGRPMNFWGFASFTAVRDHAAVLVQFVGDSPRNIIYKCPRLRGVCIGALSAFPDENEVLVPAPSMFSVVSYMRIPTTNDLLIILEQRDAALYAYIAPPRRGVEETIRQLQDVKRYVAGRCATLILDGVRPTMTYEEACVSLLTHESKTARAVAYWGLGRSRHGALATMQFADGRQLNEQQLYLEALRCDDSFSVAYNNLAETLNSTENLAVPDGRRLTKRELYLEALRCDASFGKAYANLATTLSATETFAMPDGRRLNQRQLYLEALRCDVDCSGAYVGVANRLCATARETLPDGRQLDRRQLYMEALRCDRNNGHAYFNLGNSLTATGTVALLDGRRVDQRWLYLEALREQPGQHHVRLPRQPDERD